MFAKALSRINQLLGAGNGAQSVECAYLKLQASIKAERILTAYAVEIEERLHARLKRCNTSLSAWTNRALLAEKRAPELVPECTVRTDAVALAAQELEIQLAQQTIVTKILSARLQESENLLQRLAKIVDGNYGSSTSNSETQLLVITICLELSRLIRTRLSDTKPPTSARALAIEELSRELSRLEHIALTSGPQ